MIEGDAVPVRFRPAWGTELILDLAGCNLPIISNRASIEVFVLALVTQIGMEAYGPPVLERFALDDPDAAGFTAVQLITTSSISAHFSELRRTAYLNVFSCRDFNTRNATEFIEAYFGGHTTERWVLRRGASEPIR